MPGQRPGQPLVSPSILLMCRFCALQKVGWSSEQVSELLLHTLGKVEVVLNHCKVWLLPLKSLNWHEEPHSYF